MHYQESIKSIAEQEMASLGVESGQGIGVRTRIIRECFAKEDEEIKQQVYAKVEEEKIRIQQERDDNVVGPRQSADYQRYVQCFSYRPVFKFLPPAQSMTSNLISVRSSAKLRNAPGGPLRF